MSENKKEKVVLVVEDNDINMRLNEIILTSINYKVIKAFDGKQALELMKQHKNEIDLVLLDLQLPEISGFELLQIFKNNPETSNIPVVISSALVMEEDLKKAFDFGCDSYLKKPINVNEFINNIKSAIPSEE